MKSNATIHVVDDDPAARDSVAALATAHGAAVAQYESGVHFLNQFHNGQEGVVVLDVKMAEVDGLEVLRRFRRRGAANPVIVITGHGDIPTAVEAMHNGAWTFLEKPCNDRELWSNIEAAMNRESHLSEEARQRRRWAEKLGQLSPEEERVLDRLMQGDANKRIAQELDIGQRTVELRRASIMRRMEADSVAELVKKVIAAQQLT